VAFAVSSETWHQGSIKSVAQRAYSHRRQSHHRCHETLVASKPNNQSIFIDGNAADAKNRSGRPRGRRTELNRMVHRGRLQTGQRKPQSDANSLELTS